MMERFARCTEVKGKDIDRIRSNKILFAKRSFTLTISRDETILKRLVLVEVK